MSHSQSRRRAFVGLGATAAVALAATGVMALNVDLGSSAEKGSGAITNTVKCGALASYAGSTGARAGDVQLCLDNYGWVRGTAFITNVTAIPIKVDNVSVKLYHAGTADLVASYSSPSAVVKPGDSIMLSTTQGSTNNKDLAVHLEFSTGSSPAHFTHASHRYNFN